MTLTARLLIAALVTTSVAAPLTRAETLVQNTCPIPPEYGCADLSKRPAPPGTLSGVSRLRQEIVEAAKSQIGRVTSINPGNGEKCGAGNLATYYTAAYGPVGARKIPKADWDKIKRPLSVRNVPDPDKPGEFKSAVDDPKLNEWCGIFALWATKQGAIDYNTVGSCEQCRRTAAQNADLDPPSSTLGIELATWGKTSSGWGITGLPFVRGTQGIQPGDVVYFKGSLSHQAIVERVVGGKIYTIDGNQECQQIGRVARDLSSVYGYYRVE